MQFIVSLDLEGGTLTTYDSGHRGTSRPSVHHRAVANGIRRWVALELAEEEERLGTHALMKALPPGRRSSVQSVSTWPLAVNPSRREGLKKIELACQENGYDCAVFAVVAMRCLLAGVDLSHTQAEVTNFWRPMLSLEWHYKMMCDPHQWLGKV